MKSKYILFAVLFVFSGMVSICQALPANLLSNPGFETGTTQGWLILGDFLGVKSDNEYYVYGSHAFWNQVYQGQFSAAGGNYDGRPPLQFSQEITVMPNSEITLGYSFAVSYPANSSYDSKSIFRIYVNSQLLVENHPNVWLGTWYNISTSYITQPNETFTLVTFEHIRSGPGGGNTLGYSFDNFYALGEVPEPATLLLLGFGAAIVVRPRRK